MFEIPPNMRLRVQQYGLKDWARKSPLPRYFACIDQLLTSPWLGPPEAPKLNQLVLVVASGLAQDVCDYLERGRVPAPSDEDWSLICQAAAWVILFAHANRPRDTEPRR